MRFAHPHLLWALLVLVPGLAYFLWRAWRRKQWLISQFVQSRLLSQLTVGVSAVRQKIRLALLVSAAALLVVVLARPQWGFSYEEARQRGLDIVVAIDTSNSMLANDVPPNRLERARLAVLDLLQLARTDRLGLVAFAGTAFLQCPLTTDDQAFRQSLQALNSNIIPQGGTAVAEAIRAAQEAFEEDNDNYKVLVLFTDGEDHDGRAVDAARQAERRGLRIFTIGVGTANGELIRAPGATGTEFLKDAGGQVVKSRLNEPLLREIAQAAQGFYLLLSGANTMETLYERGLEPLPKSEFATRQVKRWHERYQWFLGLVIMLLLVEMFVPERKRAPRPTPAAPEPPGSPPPLRASLSRTAGLLLLLVSIPAMAAPGASPKDAFKLYQRGDYEGALAQYERLLEETPNDPRLHFNAGTAAFQAGDFVVAEQHFQASLLSEDVTLQEKAYYNLGNTAYRNGAQAENPQDKLAAWGIAVGHFESALKLDENDEDARFNRDLVQWKIDDLKARLEAARLAKLRADEEVKQRRYQSALRIVEEQYQRDPTNTTYESYIERLRQINQIANPTVAVPPPAPAPAPGP